MKTSILLVSAGLCCRVLVGATPDAVRILATAPLRFEPAGTASDAFVARGARYRFEFSGSKAILRSDGRNISLRFDGADSRARLEGESQLRSKTNLFLGNDPAQWRRDVANYGRLRVPGIYPGIDLIYYGNASDLEYDLRVAPGADPSRIRLRIDGAHARVDHQGDLIADLIQKRPVAYQIDASGTKIPVKSRYRRNRDGSYGFQLAAYDRTRGLIIDPVLTLSVYLSGSNQDIAYAVAQDQIGFVYVAGTTNSTDFPNGGNPPQTTNGGSGDVFVTKIDPHAAPGSQIVFSTFVGGSSTETFGGLAIGPKGDIYLTGSTESTDFPCTSGGVQTALKNPPNTNAFVVWINASQRLAYASYFGGSHLDIANGIAADSSGHFWITGGTQSDDFPNVGGIQGGRAGSQDIFIVGFDPTQSGGASVLYSSFLGGSSWDVGRGIAIAPNGTVWVAGASYSYDAPTLNGYQLTYRSAGDAYVAHVDPGLGANGLLYATFLGGSGLEEARKLVLDPSGRVTVTGYTTSPDFPVTANPLQQKYGGNTDAFIAVLDPTNTSNRSAQLVYSTYFGGANGDVTFDLKRASTGVLYLSGMTMSPGLPATSTALQPAWDGSMDAFILLLDPSQAGAAGVKYFSYLGSDGLQVGYGVDFDSIGDAYLVGSTSGPIFDAFGGAQKTSPSGKTDAFVAGFQIAGSGGSHLSQDFSQAGGSSTVPIAYAADSNWTASSALDWVTVSPNEGTGNGSVMITVAPNTSTNARQGTINIAGESYIVRQSGSAPRVRR